MNQSQVSECLMPTALKPPPQLLTTSPLSFLFSIIFLVSATLLPGQLAPLPLCRWRGYHWAYREGAPEGHWVEEYQTGDTSAASSPCQRPLDSAHLSSLILLTACLHQAGLSCVQGSPSCRPWGRDLTCFPALRVHDPRQEPGWGGAA